MYEPVKSPDGRGTIFTIGESVSHLPVSKPGIVSEYLLNMIDLLERGKTDSFRTIAQVLIDAGATLEPPQINDPDPENINRPPAITFRVQSAKLSGYVNIFYDRSMDYYGINVLDGCGTIVDTISDIDCTSMADVIQRLVDDETWRIAKVEFIKKAQPARKAS